MESRNRLLVGQIALERGMVTKQHLQECLDLQAGQAQPRPIGTLLVENGFLTEAQLASLIQEQQRRLTEDAPYAVRPKEEVSFGKLLISGGYVRSDQVNEALRAQQDLADRGIRRRLGEMLVEAGHLKAETVLAVLKMQGKTLMSCTFCGAHVNVLKCLSDRYPCRKCGMPLAETPVMVSADETAYLLPPVEAAELAVATERATRRKALAPAETAPTPAAAPPRRGINRDVVLFIVIAGILALLFILVNTTPR